MRIMKDNAEFAVISSVADTKSPILCPPRPEPLGAHLHDMTIQKTAVARCIILRSHDNQNGRAHSSPEPVLSASLLHGHG